MNIVHVEYSIATKSLDIFCSGCNPPYCNGCCNPELWDFESGKNWKKYCEIISEYIHKYGCLIDRIFLVGGSPNHQDIHQMKSFLEWISNYSKDIYIFAKESLENIQPIFKKYCSHIKCGKYDNTLICNDNIEYGIKLATSNQHIYKRGIDY